MNLMPEIVAQPINIAIKIEPPKPARIQYTFKNKIIANINETNEIRMGANQ